MYSVNYQHSFLKSTDKFLSNDCYGPSTLSVYSRGLKIEPQCTVRSHRNRSKRQGSLVTKIVDNQRFLFLLRNPHPHHHYNRHCQLNSHRRWCHASCLAQSRRRVTSACSSKRHGPPSLAGPTRAKPTLTSATKPVSESERLTRDYVRVRVE